jgi:beta-mannanase
VFNPTTDTYEGTTDIRTIYPGDDYVDVLGLDGYNWGNTGLGWGPWRTFEDIYREQYDRLVALHPTAPVWICEVGCKEPSYDDGAPRIKSASKGRWITDMFAATTFPRVRAVCWFQGNKERDWRVSSSNDALKAIRSALDQMPA